MWFPKVDPTLRRGNSDASYWKKKQIDFKSLRGETNESGFKLFIFLLLFLIFFYFILIFLFFFLTFWKSNAVDSSSSSYSPSFFFFYYVLFLLSFFNFNPVFFSLSFSTQIILLSWNCISCVWLYVLTFLLCKFFQSFLHFHFCCMQLFFFTYFTLTLILFLFFSI